MKKFNLDTIKALIEQALLETPTGDDWLDSRYNEQVHYIGHTNPYYRLFYLLARELQPALSVELGSWQATGAAHFAAGYPAGKVITIDIHKDDKAAQQRAVEAAAHYNNLAYLNMWTWDAVTYVPTGIDILFIDAWHDYQYARREWDLYFPRLSGTALVIADDITGAYNFEGMERFWNELPGPKFLDDRVHPGIPMGFICLGGENNVEPNRGTNRTVKPAVTRPVAGRTAKKSRKA